VRSAWEKKAVRGLVDKPDVNSIMTIFETLGSLYRIHLCLFRHITLRSIIQALVNADMHFKTSEAIWIADCINRPQLSVSILGNDAVKSYNLKEYDNKVMKAKLGASRNISQSYS
jgi:hypothetical protein